jgi:carboxylate-amine ligase
LHVHVGIEDREAAIRIMNSLRYFLPHILALSTNSPFWLGMETGYKSYRAKVFENFPRTNLPDSFASYSEFESYVNLLIKTGSIDNAKKIWWDVRPHPFFNTVEVRVCDIPLRAQETIAIAALIQATACKLWHLHAANQDFRQYSRALLMENKFRAVRYGLDGKLIDFGKEMEVPERELIEEYLLFIDDVLDDDEDGVGRGPAAEGVPGDGVAAVGGGLYGGGDEGGIVAGCLGERVGCGCWAMGVWYQRFGGYGRLMGEFGG